RGDVLGKLLGQQFAQLRRRQASGMHVIDQGKRDHSIRTHGDFAAELVVLPNRDLQHVPGSDLVARGWLVTRRRARQEHRDRKQQSDERPLPGRRSHLAYCALLQLTVRSARRWGRRRITRQITGSMEGAASREHWLASNTRRGLIQTDSESRQPCANTGGTARRPRG